MDHPLVKRRPGFAAFLLHCCYRARFKPGWVYYRGERVYLEVGQFLFGRRRWAQETGLTERELRTHLRLAHELGMIAKGPQNSSKRFSCFEVVDYPRQIIERPTEIRINDQQIPVEKHEKATNRSPQ